MNKFVFFIVLFATEIIQAQKIEPVTLLKPDSIQSINGEWYFFWNKLYSVAEIEALEEKKRVSVPTDWRNYLTKDRQGSATYAKQITLDSVQPLAIYLKSVIVAYTVFIDSVSIGSIGIPGSSFAEEVPSLQERPFYFTPKRKTFWVIIHVSNYHHFYGGIREDILIGTQNNMSKESQKLILIRWILVCALGIVGFYNIGIFILRRQEKIPLWFGLACIVTGVHSLLINERILWDYMFFSFEFLEHLNLITYCLMSALFLIYFKSLFYKDVFEYTELILLTLNAVFIISICFLTVQEMFKILIYYHSIPIVTGCYLIYIVSKSVFKKKPLAFTALLGLLSLFLAALNDIAISLSVYHAEMVFSKVLFFFVFLNAFIVAKQYADAFTQIEELLDQQKKMTYEVQVFSKVMESMNEELGDSNKLLETRVKERTAQFEIAKEHAEEANRAKSHFLSVMTHELRTPVHAVIGYTEMLEEEMLETKEHRFLHDIKKVKSASKHLLAVVNNVLDISKIEAGIIELFIEEIALEPFLYELKSTVAPLMKKQNNKFNLGEIPEEDITILNDRTKLNQVLLNLVGNAIKFTANGTITLSVFLVPDKQICFSIADTGVGMTQTQLKRIFKEFEQITDSSEDHFGSSGLGLTISKKFVESMNGIIEVESEYQKGSTFSVILPIRVIPKS